uniref:WS_DGAT_C domain-containing protein n=1 Tax=Strongyloides papillosus TaxID=174720 RepID=A0A0N5C1E3_STREA
MSSNGSTIAGGVAIKVIFKPILGLMDARDPRFMQKCYGRVQHRHMGDDFQVFVRHPNLEYYPIRTFSHDTNVSIGSVALLLEDILTIKIVIPLNLFYDCNPSTIIPDVVYERFIEYLISRLGDNKSQVSDPIIQYVKNEVEGRSIRQLPLETLSKMDKELTHGEYIH